MAVTLTTASAQAMLDALTARIDRSAAGSIRFWSASAAAATSFIAACDLWTTAFAATNTSRRAVMYTSAGALVTEASAPKAGTVTMWRACSQDGTAMFKGSATNTGGGGDITFTSTAIGAGESVTVTSLVLTMPLTPA